MAYFLRREKKAKGVYLQMYESFWDKGRKQPRSRSVRSFGYVEELAAQGIADPVAHFKDYVEQENRKLAEARAEETRPRAFREVRELYAGHMMLHALMEKLAVRETMDVLGGARQFQFGIFDLVSQLVYARVLRPASKSKTASCVDSTLKRKRNRD